MCLDETDLRLAVPCPPYPPPQGYALCVVPYVLRAFRLVVAYNTHYRLRYARYVKGAVIKKITVTAGIGIAIAAMLVFYNVPDRYARYAVYIVRSLWHFIYTGFPVVDSVFSPRRSYSDVPCLRSNERLTAACAFHANTVLQTDAASPLT